MKPEDIPYANTHMKHCKMTIHSTCSQCTKVCQTEAHLEQHKNTHLAGVTSVASITKPTVY